MMYLRKLTAILVSLAITCSFASAFAENDKPSSAGEVKGSSNVEVAESKKVVEDVLRVVMPYEVPFTIKLLTDSRTGWIESEDFLIENFGEQDVIVKFKNIHYIFANNEDFAVAYNAEDVKNIVDKRGVFMKINTSGANISSKGCVMSNEAADSGEIYYTLAGKGAENEENIGHFNFSGAVSFPEGVDWKDNELSVSLEYELYKANPDEHEQFVIPEPEPTPIITTVPIIPPQTEPKPTEIIETVVPIESSGSAGGSNSDKAETTPKPPEIVETIVPIEGEAVETTVPIEGEIVETTVPIEGEIIETTVPIESPEESDKPSHSGNGSTVIIEKSESTDKDTADNSNNSESNDAAAGSDTSDESKDTAGSDNSSDGGSGSSDADSSGGGSGSSDSGSSSDAVSDSGSDSSDSSSGSSDKGSSSDSGSGSSDSGSSSDGGSSSGSGSGSSDSGSSSNGGSGSSDGGSSDGGGSSNGGSGSSDGGSSDGGSSSGDE